jgi:uncharacterized protein (TIGR00290 family)
VRKREGVGAAEARRPAQRDGIVLTYKETMQSETPHSIGSRSSALSDSAAGSSRRTDGDYPRMSVDTKRRTPVVMSWSGGKDSALAYHELRSNPLYDVVALMTSVSEEFRRISHHGVREELLEAQAEAIGVSLKKVYLPSSQTTPCTNEVYEAIMGRVLEDFKSQGISVVAFGDLFLEDLRAWRENNLAKAGMTGLFPIWKRDTTQLARHIIALGFKAILSCVEGKVGPGFVGRPYDERLLDDLPTGIDPCGEYGEFHSFVYDGPCFERPVDVDVGEIVVRDGRYYADIVPAGMPAGPACLAGAMPPV